MARSFGTSAVAVNVGITSYLLTLAIFIPLSGWTATRFGERRSLTHWHKQRMRLQAMPDPAA